MHSHRPEVTLRLASPRNVSQHSHQPFSSANEIESQFATIERNGLVMAAEFEPLLRAEHLDSIDRMFADDLGEPLDKPGLASWRQRRRVSLQGDGRHVFFVKRFDHPPGGARRLVRAAKNGKRTVAGLEWSWLHLLRRHGIACPRAVALGEEVAGRREIRSVLVTEAVPGQSLERWLPHWHELDPVKRRGLLNEVARLVSKLHQAGLMHRDLYLSHIFYDPSGQGAESLRLIDLQRVIRPRWRRERWIIKDLASLNFSTPRACLSRAERLRWLIVYLGTGKLNLAGRRLAYRVLGKSLHIARKENRKNIGKQSGVPTPFEQMTDFGLAGASPSARKAI